MNYYKLVKYSRSLFIYLCLLSMRGFAEDISIQPGYWQYYQSTSIDGIAAPGRNLTGGECLLKKNSNQPLEYYISKFKAGLGPETTCSITNLKHKHQQVSLSLKCISEGDIQSDHQIEYHYSKSKIDVFSEGVLSIPGSSLSIQSTNQSTWVRECTIDEIENAIAYDNLHIHSKYTQPLDKPIFTINSSGAGPIKSSLYFNRKEIESKFPDFFVKKIDIQDLHGQSSIFAVYRNDDKEAVFQIDGRQNSDVAFSIFTTNAAISGPRGERIGFTTIKELSNSSQTCDLGKNRLSRTIVCMKGNFRSLYELPKSVLRNYSPSDIIPRTAFDNATLSEMRYFLEHPDYPNHKKTKNKSESKIIKLDQNQFLTGLGELDTGKPIIVHFTSTDGSCPHCENNNIVFKAFYHTHNDQYSFVEVAFNPWRSYLKRFKRLQGLPATELYINKVAVGKVVGHRKDLSNMMIDHHKRVVDIFADDYTDVPISVLNSPQIHQMGKTLSFDKLLLINISSNDIQCAACTMQNKFIRFAARQVGSKVAFSELAYDPYLSATEDDALLGYLSSKNAKLGGLPITLVYKNGEFMGKRNGVWPTIVTDISKLIEAK